VIITLNQIYLESIFMNIAILIGRAGSSGLPGKNTLPVLGRPLAQYPLIVAQQTKSIDRLYLSTDSPELMEMAREFDAHIIERPAYLCTNEALGEDAYVHAHGVIKKELAKEGLEPSIYVLLMANSPTVSADQIEEGILALQENTEVDSAVTVSCYNMWSPLRARKINEKGYLEPFVPFETFGDPKILNCDRDSQGDVWFADMGVSVIRPQNLDDLEGGLLPQKWMGQNIHPIKNVGGLDVDFEWQMPLAIAWLRRNGITEQ
jgi:CMP-N-acetylneuraminic acid synthetase